MKSKVTERQLTAYKLVSGEFQGVATTEAAKVMGISTQAFNRLLKRMEQACPKIFPILSRREADVMALLNVGWSNSDIGEKLDLPDYTVSKIIKALQDKGRGIAGSGEVTMQRYAPHMDNKIVEKF